VRGLAIIVAAGAALILSAAAASTPLLPAQKTALAALHRAQSSGRIDAATAATGRAEVNRAAHLVRGLPSGRKEHVAVALGELAAFAGRLTQPRAIALIGQLKTNDDFFAKHYAPPPKTDITDADGVVYRYFAGRCLEFHPLANFGALNARVAASDSEGTKRLTDALLKRGVYQSGGGVGWEYYFSFGGGRAPWISGMAQAVAAQALARAAALLPDDGPALMRQAAAAYRLIPHGLLTSVAAGPWIRLYSFNSTPVLNAQLQTVLSLQSYAVAAEDPTATALALRLQRSAAATLSKFDTGYWTYYSLPREPSPPDYQQYVIQLLKKLAPVDTRFADAAARFDAYQHQPPAFKLVNGGLGTLRFWLSKPASVSVTTAAGPAKRVTLGDGWHSLSWKEPARAGVYPIHVSSVDWSGNRASFDALPIVRAAAAGSKPKSMRSTAAAIVPPPGSFSVGAGLDDPSQVASAQKLGLKLVRFGIAWPAGASTPDPGLVAALQRVPSNLGVVIELNPGVPPADEVNRTALAQYTAALVQQVPMTRYVVLAPAPASTAVSTYATVLAAIRDAVQSVAPEVAVGPLIDGSVTPKTTVGALARALAAASVSPPYAAFVAFRPAAAAGKNLWTTADVPLLVAALRSSLGEAPPVLIDGLAAAPTQTQGATYAAAINMAACSTTVAGVVLDRLVDSPTTTIAPTGVFDSTGTAKASVAVVTSAAAAAQRGLLVCPGLTATVTASTLTFPTELAPPESATVQLACDRDCLYLVTLTREDGTPVVARRGSLPGGVAPRAIGLPRTTLKPGSYRIDVRLVAQVNPGAVTRQTSPSLVVG
jgi:hypothetical protein